MPALRIVRPTVTFLALRTILRGLPDSAASRSSAIRAARNGFDESERLRGIVVPAVRVSEHLPSRTPTGRHHLIAELVAVGAVQPV